MDPRRYSGFLPLFPLRCPLHALTGIHCPTCGMGRAFKSLLLGNWSLSWQYHPLAIVLAGLLVVWVILRLLASEKLAIYQRRAISWCRSHRWAVVTLLILYSAWGFSRDMLP